MLGFMCFMVLWVLTGIYCELSVGKSFEQIGGLGRKYSPRIHIVFGTTRKM